ncbi:MAG: cytochrome c oxidase assembly protein [Acidimicrobiales bacterium]
MSSGVALQRPALLTRRARQALASLGALLTLAALLPPLSVLSQRHEYAHMLQFSLLALVVPMLVVLGAPWGWAPGAPAAARAARLADRRARHRQCSRAVGFLVLDGIVVVWWITPAAVDAAAAHGWLALVEASSLIAAGVGLWLELVESPPLVPRCGPLRRAVLAAVAMWTVWITAYIVALSHTGWYRHFHHVAGHGLSAAADLQIAAVVLWFVATVVFAPVIFANALHWLRSEEDPDEKLQRLLIEERRRGAAP